MQQIASTDQQAANDTPDGAPPTCNLITLPEVIKRVSLQRTSIYQMILSNTFPAPLKVGRASRWVDQEISLWIQGLVEQRSLLNQSSRR